MIKVLDSDDGISRKKTMVSFGKTLKVRRYLTFLFHIFSRATDVSSLCNIINILTVNGILKIISAIVRK